jgi:uncharacterized protein YjiS (DUF1127 family)
MWRPAASRVLSEPNPGKCGAIDLQTPFADVVKTSRLYEENQFIMVLVHNMFERDLIIMSASTSGANVSSAVMLPRRAALTRLAWLVRLFDRPDSPDELRHMADAQLRDIGIERHRIGPALEPGRAHWRSW